MPRARQPECPRVRRLLSEVDTFLRDRAICLFTPGPAHPISRYHKWRSLLDEQRLLVATRLVEVP